MNEMFQAVCGPYRRVILGAKDGNGPLEAVLTERLDSVEATRAATNNHNWVLLGLQIDSPLAECRCVNYLPLFRWPGV
jgi:hypothetical protein